MKALEAMVIGEGATFEQNVFANIDLSIDLWTGPMLTHEGVGHLAWALEGRKGQSQDALRASNLLLVVT